MEAKVVDDVLVVSGPDIDRVLAEVGARLGPDAEVLDARREIVGGIAGFFGKEQFIVEARGGAAVTVGVIDQPDTAADQLEPSDDSDPSSMDGPSFAAALAKALEQVDEWEPSEPAASEHPAPESPAAESPATESPAPETLATEPTAPQPSTAEPSRPEPSLVELSDSQSSMAVQMPTSAGELLSLAAQDLSEAEIRARLEELVGDPSRPLRNGVIAVVGDLEVALGAAEDVARAAGLDAGDVLLATPDASIVSTARPAWLTIADPDDAARRRERWGAADRLTIVAVALNPGAEGMRWARDILQALDAHQVRLAVPGWRRAEEIAPRLQGLGRIDLIDLWGTVDPAAASGYLGLPVPVATLDGQNATMDVWVELLRPEPVEVHQ